MDFMVWNLTAPDGTHLGRLDSTTLDMPWTYCRFAAGPAFREVAELFATELDLLNRDQMDEWMEAYERIDALGLELQPTDGGKPIREFLLHIDGEEAWFRD
jgi:hypothetical protein